MLLAESTAQTTFQVESKDLFIGITGKRVNGVFITSVDIFLENFLGSKYMICQNINKITSHREC